MLKNVTRTMIEDCEKREVTYSEYIVIDQTQVPIRAKLSDDCYDNGNFIGSFIFKTISFETSNDIEFKNKEFEYYKTINGTPIKIGTFITTEIQNNDTTEIVKVVGMDYGLKTQVEYTSSLHYENGDVTLLDVWNEACQLSGLQSGVQSFTNSNFIVESDQFTGTGALIRDVFIGIAMSSGSFIKVMNDDKIYPVFTEDTDEIIEDYTELEDKRDTQPFTCVRLGVSDVEGENVDMIDEDLVEQYGENWLILNDNPFAYTQTKRQQLITAIFNKVKGFGYSAFVSKTSFKPYLTCGDKVKFRNKNGDLIDSIVLRYTHEYKEDDMQITLEAPSETSATVSYVYPESAIDIAKRTEIIVDKEMQTITSLAEEVGEYDNRITTVEQDVNTIRQTAISYEDLKRNVKSVNMLHLENAVPNYPLKFSIKNASVLFPQINLYPGSNTIPEYRHLVLVVDKTRNLSDEAKIIELPVKNLYAKDDVYDEFVVEKNRAKLIHRLILNQGELQPLQQEFVEDLGEVDIQLFEGDNYIYLYSLINDGAIYEIDYTIPSEFTDTFATEVYVNSSIEQTANQILLQVNEKVDEEEIIAKLNVAVEDGQGIVELKGNSVIIESDNFTLDADGKIDATSGEIGGFDLDDTSFSVNVSETRGPYTASDVTRVRNIFLGNVTPTSADYEKYDINGDGAITSVDYANISLAVNNTGGYITKAGTFSINSNTANEVLLLKDTNDNIITRIGMMGQRFSTMGAERITLANEDNSDLIGGISTNDVSLSHVSTGAHASMSVAVNGSDAYLDLADSNNRYMSYSSGNLYVSGTVTQGSLEERKKNFEKLENAKEILQNTDIYKYNFKTEEDTDKKHIGFVIGDNFNYSQDITSGENNGVDIYAMVSVLWQVVKEQQDEIDELKKLIKEGDK